MSSDHEQNVVKAFQALKEDVRTRVAAITQTNGNASDKQRAAAAETFHQTLMDHVRNLEAALRAHGYELGRPEWMRQ